ncbi:MAG: deoxyuridine 5'-triphosphate nucleotidohydrolase [Candidatus Micrarchaeia archaeon]
MIITGKDIEFENMIEGTIWQGQYQPAGVDLSLQSVWEFETDGEIDGDNSKRRLAKAKQILWDDEKPIKLKAGAYKIVFNEIVSIPPDAAAIARSRSSVLRCGASVQTAVWDPGYKGRSEALLVVSNPHGLLVHKNAKVAQLVFIRLEKKAASTYSGKYQGENI